MGRYPEFLSSRAAEGFLSKQKLHEGRSSLQGYQPGPCRQVYPITAALKHIQWTHWGEDQMRTGLWLVLVVGLALAAGTVSYAIADEAQNARNGYDGKIGFPAPVVSPDAPVAKVLSVRWWKNGVDQGNIAFSAEYPVRIGTIYVTDDDLVMFRVSGLYKSGTGTGYLVFWDDSTVYGESWLLKPGVTTTRVVGRINKWPASSNVRVEAHLPGSDYSGPGDWTRIDVVVV
jgi:hypothetical protein